MNKLIATLVASMFAASAFAQQTGSTPPVQPAAGTPASTSASPTTGAASTSTSMSTDKKELAKQKRTARKMKRAEKVGDKPIN